MKMDYNKTIILLCGFIGSGKTTYANKKFNHVTDLDYMPAFSSKINQINLTLNLLKKYDEVCHITCFPTKDEMRAFKKFNKKFLLMDTNLSQCKTNILIRARPRDLMNLNRVFKANIDYQRKYKLSGINWELVKVFK